MRVKRGHVLQKRHRKVIDDNAGFRGRTSVLFRVACQKRMKALKHAYRGRKLIKRQYRRLWICRLNAAVRLYHMTYSFFIARCKQLNTIVNRKWLSQMAVRDPQSFDLLVRQINTL